MPPAASATRITCDDDEDSGDDDKDGGDDGDNSGGVQRRKQHWGQRR